MTATDDRTRIYSTPCMTSESHRSDGIYWSGPLVLAGYATLRNLREAYEPGPGRHWFDPDTFRFFGSRNLHLVTNAGGCCTVECQTNAPGDRYRVTVWAMQDGRPTPAGGCRHATLRQARACARRYFDHLADPSTAEIPAPWNVDA